MTAAPPAREPSRVALLLILVLYLCAAVAYGLITPVYEGPDEIGHVLYVQHIAGGLGIPVQSREYAIAYGFGQEGSQPPLYYAFNAVLVRTLGLSLSELDGLPPANPFTTCGRPHTSQNVAGFRHDPHQEAFPYQGSARAVHVMRLFSALLGVATIGAIYAATRVAFPETPLAAVLAAALVAFNPQFAFMGGVVNNDNLVNCLTALSVALTLTCVRHGFTWWRSLGLGLICGLAPLAKLGGLLALAFAGLGLLLALRDQIGADKRGLLQVIGQSAIVLAAFAAVSGWWFVRNWTLYGDPTGTSMMVSIYGGRGGWPAPLVIPEIVETFRSYWGAFACGLRLPPAIYWLFAVLVGMGIAGWIRGWRIASGRSRSIAVILLIWLGLVAVLWVRWNQITYAPLGRLLFQANAAVGPLLGFGLVHLTARPRWVVASVATVLLALTLVGALLIVQPAFALPDRYPVSSSPAPPQALPEAIFGDEIRVLGYALSSSSLEPGETIDVSLYLQAMRPINEDYALALQLISPVPGDEAVLINFNTFPGGGAYGTTAWRPEEVIIDRYRLQIPQQVDRVQAWRVTVIFYHPSDGKRLPVSVAGQPAGDTLGLGLVRVGAPEPVHVPAQAQLDPAPVFGEMIALRGADILGPNGHENASRGPSVTLWWEAIGAPDEDYTVFVHLLDEEGHLVGTGDGPPMSGGFPTSMWQPSDQVEDRHVVAVPPGLSSGVYSVSVGWYDTATGARLPVRRDGEQSPDDSVVIGTWRVQ